MAKGPRKRRQLPAMRPGGAADGVPTAAAPLPGLPDDQPAPSGLQAQDGTDQYDPTSQTPANTDQDDPDEGGMDVPAPADTAEEPTSDSLDIEEDEDGGAVVTFGKPRTSTPENDSAGWFANLAETADEADLSALAAEVIAQVEKDIESRQPRMDRYAEGIRRTGIVEDAPGGAEFEGASKVTHPLLTEVAVDYGARLTKELFPRTGPLKSGVQGTWTNEKQARADRKTAYFNLLILRKAPEIRAAFEDLGMQQPLSGEGYIKPLWDFRRKRPTVEFVDVADVIFPAYVTSFQTAHRYTHRQTITRAETESRIRDGLYREVPDLDHPTTSPETTPVEEADQKIAGEAPNFATGEGTDEIFEVCRDMVWEPDTKAKGKIASYIVTVSRKPGIVFAIRRNWAQKDETRERLPTMVQFGLLPWKNGTYLGIWELAGGIAKASTGALRALLDSALVNNSISALRLEGTRIDGQTLNPQQGQISTISGSAGVDDIRKLAMPLPFNPPSPVLFELLQFLVAAGKSLLQTSLENTPMDSNANTPVGTQLSRVEQAMTVFSSVFSRQHSGFTQVIQIMHWLCSLYMDDEVNLEEDGELIVRRMDFEGPCDVLPTSDPDIYSDMQRYAQLQAVRQMATTAPPGMYDLKAVDKRLLKLMHVDGIDELMPEPTPPPRRHAVAENSMMAMATPVIAYPDQDHLAHLKVHLDFALSPSFGMGPLLGPRFLPMCLGHIKQHVLMFYSNMAFHTMRHAADLKDMDDLTASIADQNAMDAALATLSGNLVNTVNSTLQEVLSKVHLLVQAVQQMAAQTAPQATDPSIQVAQITAQSRQAETQTRAQIEQTKTQAELQKAQMVEGARAQVAAGELDLEKQKLAQDAAIHTKETQAGIQREAIEDRTALAISAERAKEAERDANIEVMNADADRRLKAQELAANIAAKHQQAAAAVTRPATPPNGKHETP